MSNQTSESLLYLNGINGATGEPTQPVSADIVARVLRGETIEPHHLGVLQKKKREKEATLGPAEGIDPQDLAQTGWGVIFAFEDRERIPAIREALKELLDLRKEQAGPLYREFTGLDAYRPGDSKMDFLTRHDVHPGAVDPKRGVPYYLLIVGDPATIPYTFQYQLDVQFAVGRIWFDTLDEYASYARSVVAAEKGEISLPRTATFFGTQNPDDRATELSATKLVAPLAEHIASAQQTWNVRTLLKEEAKKASLIDLMGGNGGNETPAFLFSASHGLYLPNGHANQFAHQGALVCQDWPGRQDHSGPLPQDFYLAGDDIGSDARLMGQIAFFFACFGAGTPEIDDFWQQAGIAERSTLAPYPFLSHLPQRMLGHPKGGALAVVGHVDRAWSYSFAWGHQETAQLTTFESTLKQLMKGGRLGSAIEYFNTRYAEIASDLHTRHNRNPGILQRVEQGLTTVSDRDLAELWVMTNDSRNYVVMGDPAVRLPVGNGATPTKRPTIPDISSIPPAPHPEKKPGLRDDRGDTSDTSDRDTEVQNTPTPDDSRQVCAWVDGLPEDEPLRVGLVYDLKFEIAAPDSPPRSATRYDAQWQAPTNSRPYTNVLIILETRSFRVYGEQQQTLVLPHEGRSRNTATFCIEPQKLGPGEIIALCLTNGYLCQKMTITLQVGETEAKTQGRSVRTQVNGMTLGSGITRSLRQTRKQAPEATTTLAIIKTEDGYQAVLQNAQSGVVRAHLNVSEKQITDMLARTRDDLKFVLSYRMDGRSVYQQEDPRIPLEAHLASRNILAQLGSHLYQQLFYAPERSPDARAMGDLLRLLSRQQPMNIEIVTERFVFPWALLYDRDLSKPEQVNTDGFWGFRHIIQHLPEFYGTALVPIASEITVEDAFTVGFFSEQSLESESGLPLVQKQRDALETLPGVKLRNYPNCQDLYDLLSNPDAPEHLLSFFCRAESYFPGDQTRSKIVLSDGDIRLDDLVSKVPASLPPLKQSPLVFLNACQSTQLNPYLYNGLVPYLMSRGIRGVVGTESEVPAPFAADFARRFIQRFATGNQTLGETLLRLRQEYLSHEHNLLGLFYGLYSNGEIIVRREQPAGENKEETPRVLSPGVSFEVPAAGVSAAEPETAPAEVPRTLGGQSYNVIGDVVNLMTGKKKEDTEQSLLDQTKDTLFGSVQEFTQKLGESLRNVMEDVSSLDISTYVSDDLTDEVVKNLTSEGRRVAFTRIKFDGDTEACVPIDEGDIDETLWKMHLEMVERAQVHRAELIKTLTEAASELVNVFK